LVKSAKSGELLKLRDVLADVEDRVSRAILDAVDTLHQVLTDHEARNKDRIDAAGKIIDMARAKAPLVQVNVASQQIGPRDFSGASVPRLFEGPAQLTETLPAVEQDEPEPKVVSAAPIRRVPTVLAGAQKDIRYEAPVSANEDSPGPTLDQAQQKRRDDMPKARVNW
jgi:hypothetical protein